MNCRYLFLLGLSWVPFTLCASDWIEQIGYARLVESTVGSELPEGRGVSLTQVEASGSGGGHLPQDGIGRFQGYDAFAGKTFHARSGQSSSSDHAQLVGHFLYGARDVPSSFGAMSLSPQIAEIDLFQASVGEYLGARFLVPGSSKAPIKEVNAIQNHSWSGQMGTASVAYMNERLRRLDYSVSSDDYLCVVALANGVAEPIPPLLASAYNVLTVGCSHGDHSHGFTNPDLDGGARTKVDLVAPLSATSFATPVVSSAAALLLECAGSEDAKRSEVLRAILMAGASKSPFPTWIRSSELPFDPQYGAGELRVDQCHKILMSDQWHYEALARPLQEFPLMVNEEQQDLSIVLAWNRQLSFRRGKGSPGVVADMTLRLYSFDEGTQERRLVQDSMSVNENREHVYARGLRRGRYVIVVESDKEAPYGLAWNAESVRIPKLRVGASSVVLSDLAVGQSYRLESTGNLKDWAIDQDILAETADYEFPWTNKGERYYRLAW